jgi:inward rectifier potassium channel
MAKIIRVNARAQTDETTGYGTNSTMYGGRLMNKDGQPNIHKTGIGTFEKTSWYHILIKMRAWKFLSFIFLYFLFLNLIFAMVYYFIGVEHLEGMHSISRVQQFVEAFFFSAQTFTTVGYGRISPIGYLTSFVAAFEAFTGLLFFALATGLFYARFSRPQAYLRFSHNALIAPYKDSIALMCRMAPFKNNYLTDAEVKLTLAMVVEEDGQHVNRFYPLHLEIARVNALSLNWTLVHPVDSKSPFYNLQEEDLKNHKAEIFVFVRAFDDTFSNTVVARTSYSFHEFIFGARFKPMYHRSEDKSTTIMEMDKLNSYEKVDISSLLHAGR